MSSAKEKARETSDKQVGKLIDVSPVRILLAFVIAFAALQIYASRQIIVADQFALGPGHHYKDRGMARSANHRANGHRNTEFGECGYTSRS